MIKKILEILSNGFVSIFQDPYDRQDEAYLANSVDTADLEWRLKEVEHRRMERGQDCLRRYGL